MIDRIGRARQSGRKIWALLFVLLALFCVIFFAARGRFQATASTSTVGTVLAPFEMIFSYAGQQIQHVTSNLWEIATVHEQNKMLKNEIDQLRQQNTMAEEYAAENARLRELLAYKQSAQQFDLLAARVIGRDAAQQAGAREAYLIEEPMAAAIGAGLPVEEATGSMVVDIGGGTTEIAVISLGGIVTSRSIRIGGDEMDSSIVQYIKRMYNLMIGERTAEEIKISVGTAIVTPDTDRTMDIRGRDLVSGLPKTLTIHAKEIREALNEPIYKIIDAVKNTLEKTPPELAADVMDHGIMMTGGGALLMNLDKLLSHETGMPVLVSEDALSCVGEGTGRTLENIGLLKNVVMASKKLKQ